MKTIREVLKRDLPLLIADIADAIEQIPLLSKADEPAEFGPQVIVGRATRNGKPLSVIGISSAWICKTRKISYSKMAHMSYDDVARRLSMSDGDLLTMESALECLSSRTTGTSQIYPLLEIYRWNLEKTIYDAWNTCKYAFPPLICNTALEAPQFITDLRRLAEVLAEVQACQQ